MIDLLCNSDFLGRAVLHCRVGTSWIHILSDGALFTLSRNTGRAFASGAKLPLCEWYSADQMRVEIACRERLQALYSELLMAVSKKYPGETRHHTALRYIRQAETEIVSSAQESMK